jgi:hypothetical protein
MEINPPIPQPNSNWFYDHSLVFRIVLIILLTIFLICFVWLIKSMYKMDSFFARFSKIWSVVCLSLRLVFILFYVIWDAAHNEKYDFWYHNKFVIQHFYFCVDFFLVIPIICMILPIHALG